MESIEAEGSSIDEAISRALSLLGASRERVDVDILSNATRGLFGFGGKPARVRATLRRSPGATTADGPAAEAALASAPAAPASPSGDARPRRAGGGAAPERPAAATPPAAAALERGRTILTEIVTRCGVEASVRIAGATLVIDGDRSGILIGRRGTMLDALEYLVNRAVGHDDPHTAHIEVDANDYRARRRAAIEALARRMGKQARSQGRPVTLSPMSPRERRVVHLVLQGDPMLTTRSAGDGLYRRVTIVPTAPRR